MKIAKHEFEEIKKGIEAKGIGTVKTYKEQLKKAQANKSTVTSDFDTRFIFGVYYGCVPLATRMAISNNDEYKDTHIKTATKKALKELGLL